MNFFDKYRKWIIVFFSVFLMISMTLPSWFSGRAGNRADPVGAKLWGTEELRMGEIELAKYEWELLTSIRLSDQFPVTLASRMFMGDPRQYLSTQDFFFALQYAQVGAAHISQSPSLFALLKREAVRAGIRPSRDRVEEILRNQVRLPPNADPERVTQIRRAIESIVMIETLADQHAAAVKVTRPEVESRMAQELQSLKVGVAVVDATPFRAQVPPPTQEALSDLFTKFGNASSQDLNVRTNPFGFGYLQGDRVRLDYILLPRAELLRASRVSREPYDWEVEASKFYAQNRALYMTDAPATRPALDLGLNTTPAAPSTEKVLRPFAEVRQQILDRLIDNKADQIAQQVQRRIVSILGADFRAYSDALAKKSAAPASSVGPAYDSADYLRAVAARVESETGVRASITSFNDKFLTADDLKLDLIGKTRTPGPGDRPVTFPDYVFTRAKPFFESAGARIPGAVAFEIYEPTPPFADDNGGVYLARVLEARPSRVPKLDEVEAAVREDAISMGAQERAVAIAETLMAEGKSQLLTTFATSRNLPNAVISSLRASTELPPPLNQLSPQSRQLFVIGAYSLLRNDPSIERPRTVISLPRERKAIIVELESVEQLAAGDSPERQRLEVFQAIRAGSQLDFLNRYFRRDTILARTKFTPTADYRGELVERSPGSER